MYLELEEVVPRRNFKLRVRWICNECKPEDQTKPVKLTMCLLDGEPGKDPDYVLSETDLVHMECFKGHITRPIRYCSRCGLEYKFEDDVCKPCDQRIRRILEFEHMIEDTRESIRGAKRRKLPHKDLDEILHKQQIELDDLNGRT